MKEEGSVKREIKKNLLLLKNGTKKMFKEFFNKETNKKQRANMWTFARLIIPIITLIISIIAIISNTSFLFIGAGICAGTGAITDYFDGKSSRKHNSCSEYGKLLDQVSDKIFAGIIGINLLFINLSYIFVLLGEAMILAINVYYKTKYNDLNINSTKTGKIKEWPLFLTLAVGFLSPISNVFALISNISIILTNLFQIATVKSYIDQNSLEVKKIKNIEVINNNTEINEIESNLKELKLEKTYKKEQYIKLKELLESIIEEKNNINSKSDSPKVKIKK